MARLTISACVNHECTIFCCVTWYGQSVGLCQSGSSAYSSFDTPGRIDMTSGRSPRSTLLLVHPRICLHRGPPTSHRSLPQRACALPGCSLDPSYKTYSQSFAIVSALFWRVEPGRVEMSSRREIKSQRRPQGSVLGTAEAFGCRSVSFDPAQCCCMRPFSVCSLRVFGHARSTISTYLVMWQLLRHGAVSRRTGELTCRCGNDRTEHTGPNLADSCVVARCIGRVVLQPR